MGSSRLLMVVIATNYSGTYRVIECKYNHKIKNLFEIDNMNSRRGRNMCRVNIRTVDYRFEGNVRSMMSIVRAVNERESVCYVPYGGRGSGYDRGRTRGFRRGRGGRGNGRQNRGNIRHVRKEHPSDKKESEAENIDRVLEGCADNQNEIQELRMDCDVAESSSGVSTESTNKKIVSSNGLSDADIEADLIVERVRLAQRAEAKKAECFRK